MPGKIRAAGRLRPVPRPRVPIHLLAGQPGGTLQSAQWRDRDPVRSQYVSGESAQRLYVHARPANGTGHPRFGGPELADALHRAVEPYLRARVAVTQFDIACVRRKQRRRIPPIQWPEPRPVPAGFDGASRLCGD